MSDLDASLPLQDAQHETFAQLIALGDRSQGQAYLDAGYECKCIAVASAAASRLLKNVKVRSRIAFLQGEAAERSIADRTTILENLYENALIARELKQLAASNRAFELLGKEQGLFKDGLFLEPGKALKPLEEMTPEEALAELSS